MFLNLNLHSQVGCPMGTLSLCFIIEADVESPISLTNYFDIEVLIIFLW